MRKQASVKVFRLFALAFLVLWVVVTKGQSKYSNDFLNIGAGSRWMGMGNSGVALSNDASASYWNPAGLLSLEQKYDVTLMHASYFAGMAGYNHLGFAYKPDSTSALGITAICFGVDDIPNTTDLMDSEGNISYDRIKMFSVADYAFLLSYAHQLPIKGLQIGGNAKIVYRSVGPFASAWGFGFDVGLRYQLSNWRFGANLRDATSTVNIWSFNNDELEITVGDSTFNTAPAENFELTIPSLSLGVGREFTLSARIKLAAEVGATTYFDGERNSLIASSFASIDPRAGVEVRYMEVVAIRAGIGNIQKTQGFTSDGYILQPNIGIGLRFKGISLDYALTNAGSTGYSRYSNIFSLSWSFDRVRIGK